MGERCDDPSGDFAVTANGAVNEIQDEESVGEEINIVVEPSTGGSSRQRKRKRKATSTDVTAGDFAATANETVNELLDEESAEKENNIVAEPSTGGSSRHRKATSADVIACDFVATANEIVNELQDEESVGEESNIVVEPSTDGSSMHRKATSADVIACDFVATTNEIVNELQDEESVGEESNFTPEPSTGGSSRQRKSKTTSIDAIAAAIKKMAASMQLAADVIKSSTEPPIVTNSVRIYEALARLPELKESELLKAMDLLSDNQVKYNIFMVLPDHLRVLWLHLQFYGK